MSVDAEDEDAFRARREELVEERAEWLLDAGLPGAGAGDANVLLDWQWGYRDGELGTSSGCWRG